MGVIENIYFVSFITFESIYFKYVHSGPKFKATISHDLCYEPGLYLYSFRMWQFSNYFEDERVL